MVVFLRPVMSETLTAFLIVTSLPMTKRSTETSKMRALPTNPSCSNIPFSPSLTLEKCLPYLLLLDIRYKTVIVSLKTGKDFKALRPKAPQTHSELSCPIFCFLKALLEVPLAFSVSSSGLFLAATSCVARDFLLCLVSLA